MIEDAIFLPWPLKHADWPIYNLLVLPASLLTHPSRSGRKKRITSEKGKAVRKMKWLAKLIGLENKFSPFFGLPSLLFPRLHWRKCIKIGGDRNSISWQCFAIVYLIYLQIVPFLEFAKKITVPFKLGM